jgi:uncharacterized protein YecE (DUF72 family)
MTKAFIGTSGWSYPHWGDGVFYPKELRSSDWLSYYAQHFSTVEINFSFYRLPPGKIFEAWREKTPAHFRFAVKASRFLTHVKKLTEVDEPLRRLWTNARGLDDKLGPLLFQLPPSLPYGQERLEGFLSSLTLLTGESGCRAVLEVRNPTWLCPGCFDSLSQAGVALCLSDWPDLVVEGPLTADFVFLRRHGPGQLYASEYSLAQLEKEAQRIGDWLNQGREVFIYFNNDASGWAVKNARTLAHLLREGADRR